MWQMDTNGKVETEEEVIIDDIEDKSEEIIDERIAEKCFVKIVKKLIMLNKVIKVYEDIKLKEDEMAKQAKIEDIVIPIFDGANYTSWKFRLMTLLEYKECKEQAQTG